jgi:hypothetical protein
MKFKLFDQVILGRDVIEENLRAGAIGTVVEVYPVTDGLEVEFFDEEGETIAVLTLDAADVRMFESAPSQARK